MSRWLMFFILAVALVPCAWPQASTGSVSGTVADQSGAAIPNAEVVLTNTATNGSTTTRTNQVGFYLFRGVIPGPYRLTVQVPGMEKYEGALHRPGGLQRRDQSGSEAWPGHHYGRGDGRHADGDCG